MPIEDVSGTDLTYYLISYDKEGKERREPGGDLLSARLEKEISGAPCTDIFIFSHGWRGDVPAARDQYGRWLRVMAGQESDIAEAKKVRSGFKPLMIGLHWPSEPWGDEELGGETSFSIPPEGTSAPALGLQDTARRFVEQYAERIADSEAARAALFTIFSAAAEDIVPPVLPPEVRAAYEIINREAGLGAAGEGGSPSDDREPFDAEAAYQRSREEDEFSFGQLSLGGLLSPLRQLSFWKMKDRARLFGESGGHQLLNRLQAKTKRDVRFHLMGHSFGCIVASGMLGGPNGKGSLGRSVNSLALVQGALSLWSYCSEIPSVARQQGYFRSIVETNKVSGLFFTTQSEGDTAVGRLYPLAAGVAQQVNFGAPGGDLPKYGGLGTFGVRGPGCDIVDQPIASQGDSNRFQRGKIYNLDSSAFISGGSGASGSHNNIDRPEVAHAVWEAMINS
jgi:hypothetical protein